MVNMDQLPLSAEFAKTGGAHSLARNTTRETKATCATAAKILISRGVNALALDANCEQTNPEKSPLYNAVLAHNGESLTEGNTHIHSPEKAYAAVKESEMVKNAAMKSFIMEGLRD